MPNTEDVAAATGQWESNALRVIEFAEFAAPVEQEHFVAFWSDTSRDPEAELDKRIEELLDASDNAVEATDNRESVQILLGNLEVSDVLLAASEEPPVEFAALATSSGSLPFDDARAQLAAFKRAADGQVEPVPRALPASVLAKFDELQNAGGTELVELAKSPTVHAILIGGVESLAVVLAEKSKEAFEAVEKALTWLKKAALKIVKWVVDKLHDLLPKSFQSKLDELIESIKDKLVDGAPGIVGSILGSLLGRQSAVDAWESLSTEKVAELEPRLDETTKEQLARIALTGSARKVVDKFEVVIAALSASPAGSQVKIVGLALVVAVVGFVGFQVWDGFNNLEKLATE